MKRDGLELRLLSSKRQDSEVKYTTTPVDWLKLAGAEFSLDGNNEIRLLRNRLDELQNDHNAHSLVKAYNHTKDAAKSCLEDQSAIEQMSNEIARIDSAEVEFADYLSGRIVSRQGLGSSEVRKRTHRCQS